MTRRLHRFFGAGASVFVIFMVLTGLAINHSNQLGLAQSHVSETFVLDWYGLEGPETIDSFRAGNNWLSFAGSRLYFNGAPVATITGGTGVVSSGGILVAAGNEEILLLDRDGALIERLAWNLTATGLIESIGLMADGNVIVNSGDQLWVADSQLLEWKQREDAAGEPDWATPEPAPSDLVQTISRSYRHEGLSLERLLLDFHSGRVFGSVGVLIYDLLAIAIGFLAISGLVMWWRGRTNGKRKR